MNLNELLKNNLPDRSECCDLREHDPDFNSRHGERFFRAFDRAILRGDFN